MIHFSNNFLQKKQSNIKTAKAIKYLEKLLFCQLRLLEIGNNFFTFVNKISKV